MSEKILGIKVTTKSKNEILQELEKDIKNIPVFTGDFYLCVQAIRSELSVICRQKQLFDKDIVVACSHRKHYDCNPESI